MELDLDPNKLIDVKAIANAVKDKLEKDIADQIYWSVREQVTKEILALISDDVKKIAEESKDGILTGVTLAMPEVAKLLATTIVATAADNLKSYSGKDILAKLFGR